jgi:acyl-CoA reductase-like NAD-dependent aldehyde dehydrogenase
VSERLDVTKTYKLFIDGKFPRSESGRTVAIDGVGHVSRASRKDLRDAVVAARKALPGWKGATAYLRGQILYRMAEMLEGRRAEFDALLREGTKGRSRGGAKGKAAENEVTAAVDRLVSFAGWADKYQQVLGCNNPVAGPYYNFTVPEPVGVVGVVAPDAPALLALVSLIAPALCAGNTVVAVGGESPAALLVTAVLGEVIATSDIPPGVVNLLTGERAELAPVMASHRDIDALHAAGVSDELRGVLRAGAAENLKRVTVRDGVDWYDADGCHSPSWIEPLVEMKTIWHPSAT